MSIIDYNKEYLGKLAKNFENFNIEDKKVILKIKNFCQKFRFNEIEVKKSIKENIFLKAWFVTDPSKQNFYEKLFGEFLKNIKGVKNLKFLNKQNGVYIVNQEIKNQKDIKEFQKANLPKKMDFSFEYHNLSSIFFVFHKYTKQSGRVQDNQKNDIKKAILAASTQGQNFNPNIKVLFVCDGDYYNKKKMSELKNLNKENNFFVLKSEEIEDFLNKLIKTL